MSTRATIASAMGVARSPTQGSCRPVVTTSTGSPARSMLRPGRRRLEVGLRAMLATTSCPVEMPPRIPPAWLPRNPSGVISSRCSVPFCSTEANPAPISTPLDGVDPHQGGSELGVELSIDRLPEPARDPGGPHRDPRPDGIPFLAKRVHEAFELGHEVRIGREEGDFDPPRRDRCGPAGGAQAVRAIPAPCTRGARGGTSSRPPPAATRTAVLASRGPAAAPIVSDPVLGEIGVVGVRGPEHVADAGVVTGPRVGVLDEERDRGAGGGAFEHPGEDPDLVRLAPLGGMAAPAGPPPVEVGLEVGFGERKTGRTTVHHTPDRRAVALAERGHREMGPEGIAGHASPVPSRPSQPILGDRL